MSGTAVQRRAKDIAAAGGNPALAFTTGAEASTPSVTPARVEPTVKDSTFDLGKNIVALSQVKNLQAQTALTNEQAKSWRIRNTVDNAFALNIAALNYDLKEQAKQTSAKEYELLEQQIKNAITTGSNLDLQGEQTRVATDQTRRMTDALVRQAMVMARAGEIDLAALERVASIGGADAAKVTPIIKNIIDVMRVFFQQKGNK